MGSFAGRSYPIPERRSLASPEAGRGEKRRSGVEERFDADVHFKLFSYMGLHRRACIASNVERQA
jgi:hypothetical protein